MRRSEASSGVASCTSVRIEAPRDVVFDFLVDPDKLVRWIGTDVDMDPRAGGRFWLNVNGVDEASGEYLEVVAPERVSFTWGWSGSDHVPPGSSMVTIELSEDGDATLVVLTHSGLPLEAAFEHLEGWRHYVARLLIVGVGGDPGPDPLTGA